MSRDRDGKDTKGKYDPRCTRELKPVSRPQSTPPMSMGRSLHDLTSAVARGGSSGHATAFPAVTDRASALKLIDRKMELEAELEAYYDVLSSVREAS